MTGYRTSLTTDFMDPVMKFDMSSVVFWPGGAGERGVHRVLTVEGERHDPERIGRGTVEVGQRAAVLVGTQPGKIVHERRGRADVVALEGVRIFRQARR